MSQKNVLKLPQFRIPSSTTGVSYWHPLKRPAADFFSSCRKSRMALQRTWPEFSATDALAFQILQSPEAQKYSLPKQRFVCLSTTSGSVLQSPVLHLTLITRNPHGGVAILIWKARSWQRCPFPQSLKKKLRFQHSLIRYHTITADRQEKSQQVAALAIMTSLSSMRLLRGFGSLSSVTFAPNPCALPAQAVLIMNRVTKVRGHMKYIYFWACETMWHPFFDIPVVYRKVILPTLSLATMTCDLQDFVFSSLAYTGDLSSDLSALLPGSLLTLRSYEEQTAQCAGTPTSK